MVQMVEKPVDTDLPLNDPEAVAVGKPVGEPVLITNDTGK